MPIVSSFLLRRLEAAVPQTAEFGAAQAIVVLGGDVRLGNGGDIPDMLGPLSIERVVFAAAAYRRLRLPIAVSGGRPRAGHASEAELMTAALKDDFAVPVAWSEDRSRTTWENALFTARLLLPAKITTVVIVTHRWHLPRALWSFRRVGFTALAWPAPPAAPHPEAVEDFLPSVAALRDTSYALHELIGGVYYRLRH